MILHRDRSSFLCPTAMVCVLFLSLSVGFSPSTLNCFVSTFPEALAADDTPGNSPVSSSTTIGTKDEEKENIIQISLRKESSLLRKGQRQLEIGIDYFRSKDETTLLSDDTSRRVSMPFSFRLGLLDRLNAFISIPLQYSYREINNVNGDVSDTTLDIGDLNLGINGQLLRERLGRPEVIATLQVLAPTGTDPYGDGNTEANTGNGHWAAAGGLQLIKTSDPIVFFGGINYLHQFETRALGQDIQPGDTIEVNFGLSFAPNDDLSINGQAIGSYQDDIELDGERIDGTSEEPYYLRFALTSRWHGNAFLEYFTTLGLNDDADSYRFGVAYIVRWN